ncbi:LysM peptidoglycan-binding domain-containing protein [Flaviaesturariibacter amylovorans]|uniref:LysM domain-containing protein n=1 Tax=Flaviaesturariibacter amylovorans TaxID=1084520 RepID=A0ABP8GB82_9BACT
MVADGNSDYYIADVAAANDYYPFGMQIPGRKFEGENGYRYGVNGQEKDKEIGTEIFGAMYWEYDSRIGRRWNVDPVINQSESPFATFSNNPIYFVDPTGSTPTPPEYHRVNKGETLNGIAKKYNMRTSDLLALNSHIKDPNKIIAGSLLTIGSSRNGKDLYMEYGEPESDFQSNPLTAYNNSNNGKFVQSSKASLGRLAGEFFINSGSDEYSQNTLVIGGKFLDEIKSLPSVRDLVNKAMNALNADGKLQAGEFYKGSYSIGTLIDANGRRILWQSTKDLFSGKLQNNKFFSAENWLGSYGFSLRVTGYGKAVICIYDSKTVESASDRRPILRKITPDVEPTYQRYLWEINVQEIRKPNSTYETYGF